MLLEALLAFSFQDADQPGIRVGTPAQAAAGRSADLFQPVHGNWSLSCADPQFLGHRIQFDLSLDADGRIAKGPTVVRPRADPAWRAAAESARQALLVAAPFDVAADFDGGDYRPTFDTSRACARASGPDED